MERVQCTVIEINATFVDSLQCSLPKELKEIAALLIFSVTESIFFNKGHLGINSRVESFFW